MKATSILINWMFSFVAIAGIDTGYSSLWAVLIAFGWFSTSSALLIYADKKGWMNKITKPSKKNGHI